MHSTTLYSLADLDFDEINLATILNMVHKCVNLALGKKCSSSTSDIKEFIEFARKFHEKKELIFYANDTSLKYQEPILTTEGLIVKQSTESCLSDLKIFLNHLEYDLDHPCEVNDIVSPSLCRHFLARINAIPDAAAALGHFLAPKSSTPPILPSDDSETLCAEDTIEFDGIHQNQCSSGRNAYLNATTNADFNPENDSESCDVESVAAPAVVSAAAPIAQVPAEPRMPTFEVIGFSEDKKLNTNTENHSCEDHLDSCELDIFADVQNVDLIDVQNSNDVLGSMSFHQRGGKVAYETAPAMHLDDARTPLIPPRPPTTLLLDSKSENKDICTEIIAKSKINDICTEIIVEYDIYEAETFPDLKNVLDIQISDGIDSEIHRCGGVCVAACVLSNSLPTAPEKTLPPVALLPPSPPSPSMLRQPYMWETCTEINAVCVEESNINEDASSDNVSQLSQNCEKCNESFYSNLCKCDNGTQDKGQSGMVLCLSFPSPSPHARHQVTTSQPPPCSLPPSHEAEEPGYVPSLPSLLIPTSQQQSEVRSRSAEMSPQDQLLKETQELGLPTYFVMGTVDENVFPLKLQRMYADSKGNAVDLMQNELNDVKCGGQKCHKTFDLGVVFLSLKCEPPDKELDAIPGIDRCSGDTPSTGIAVVDSYGRKSSVRIYEDMKYAPEFGNDEKDFCRLGYVHTTESVGAATKISRGNRVRIKVLSQKFCHFLECLLLMMNVICIWLDYSASRLFELMYLATIFGFKSLQKSESRKSLQESHEPSVGIRIFFTEPHGGRKNEVLNEFWRSKMKINLKNSIAKD